MNRLKNRILRLLKIEGAEPIGLNDAVLNEIDRRMCISKFLYHAEEIYEASLEDIIDAIKHSSVCQLENCENKLCSLFKSYLFKNDHGLTRFKSFELLCCVNIHKIYLCKDEMCPVPGCWDYKERSITANEIRGYYAKENRDISKDYNNNDE
jgi:hypothetical protein